MNTASETSSVMMTSLDMGLLELYVDEGFSFANRNRACTRDVRGAGSDHLTVDACVASQNKQICTIGCTMLIPGSQTILTCLQW